jgi:hypothetical protein
MRRVVRAFLVAWVTAAVALAAPPRAHADPDYGKLFDNFTLGFRGFTGVAPFFGTSFANGGDLHLALEWSSFGLVVGGRFGAAGDDRYLGPSGARPLAAQFALGDVGCRGFLNPRDSTGYYVGGGLSFGSTFVDGFAFRNASLFSAYAEGGIELPRTSPLRFTAALRVDVGSTSRMEFSRVPAAGAVVMVTANVGFLFGGERTGSEPD